LELKGESPEYEIQQEQASKKFSDHSRYVKIVNKNFLKIEDSFYFFNFNKMKFIFIL